MSSIPGVELKQSCSKQRTNMVRRRPDQPVSLFYSNEGILKIVSLSRAACEEKGQNQLAKRAGVSPTTFTSLWRSELGITSPPLPDTLMRIASVVTDPETGMNFDPWKFLAIATNPRAIPFFPPSAPPRVMAGYWAAQCSLKELRDLQSQIESLVASQSQSSKSMSNIACILRDRVKTSSLASVASLTGIAQTRINEIIDSSVPLSEKEWKQLENLATDEEPLTATLLKRLDPDRVMANCK